MKNEKNMKNKMEGSMENRKENALKAAHELFDIYCGQALIADAMFHEPEDWVDGYDYCTEDEVLLASEEIYEDCEDLLETAKELWMVSKGLNDVNTGRAEMLS